MNSVLIILSTIIALSNGWWDNGHMLTAQIAKLDLLARNKTVYDRVDALV